MTPRKFIRPMHVAFLVAALATPGALFAAPATLFIGTDTNFFNGVPSSLVKATVDGANFVSQITIPLDFPLNGLGDGPGFLYAGDPGSNTLRTIDYNGNLLTSIPAGFPNTRFNEEMQFAGGKFYHAHFSDVIQQIDPTTGLLLDTFQQPDVVGMALVGSTIWITHWSAMQVGTWDPGTNTFTLVFSTPSNAGALAFDPINDLMWVGLQGGNVVPYTLGGIALNGGFQPFGAIPDTIDGLTFKGEGSQVPEPNSLALIGIVLVALTFFSRRKRS